MLVPFGEIQNTGVDLRRALRTSPQILRAFLMKLMQAAHLLDILFRLFFKRNSTHRANTLFESRNMLLLYLQKFSLLVLQTLFTVFNFFMICFLPIQALLFAPLRNNSCLTTLHTVTQHFLKCS